MRQRIGLEGPEFARDPDERFDLRLRDLDPVEGTTVNHGEVGDLEHPLNVDVERGCVVVAKHSMHTCRKAEKAKGPLDDQFRCRCDADEYAIARIVNSVLQLACELWGTAQPPKK